MFKTITSAFFSIYLLIEISSAGVTKEEKENTEKTLQNFFNLQKSTNETEWISISEMQIKSPLESQKRFLGWYVDGSWSVDDKELNFLNYNENNFIMTNNIFLKSPKISYFINFTVNQDFEKWDIQQKKLLNNPEVLVFLLSSKLYDIKNFDETRTTATLKGLGIFLFKAGDGYTLLAQPFYTNMLYDFQAIYRKVNNYNRNYSCKIDYMNKKTKLQFNVDFEKNNIEIITNERKCLDFPITNQLLEQNKVGFTFTGYSSNLSPIKVNLHEFSAVKLIKPDPLEKTFHSEVRTFVNALNKHDPLFNKNSSMSNVMLIEGKIDKELDNTKKLIELMMNRSKVIEKSLEGDKDKDPSNVFFNNKKFRTKMQNSVSSLESFMTYNNNIGEELKFVLEGFTSIDKLMQFKSKLDKVKNIINILDSFVEVEEFEKILGNLNDISEKLKTKNFNTYASYLISFTDGIKKKLKFSTTFQILVFIYCAVIFGLVFLIFRKISQKMKNHAF